MTDPIRVTPVELRAHADCVGEVPYHREMVLRAAARIEALEAAIRKHRDDSGTQTGGCMAQEIADVHDIELWEALDV